MRNWRVIIRTADGRQLATRSIKIADQLIVLRADHVLPGGMPCDLQIVVPALDARKPASVAEVKAVVAGAIFSEGIIRLDLQIESIDSAAKSIIDARIYGG